MKLSCIKCDIEYVGKEDEVKDLIGAVCPICGNQLTLLTAEKKKRKLVGATLAKGSV